MLGWGLLAASAMTGWWSCRSSERCELLRDARWRKVLRAIAIMFLAQALSHLHWASLGFSAEVLAPRGSFLTRTVIDLPADLRRTLEPSLWILFLGCGIVATLSDKSLGKLALAASSGCLVADMALSAARCSVWRETAGSHFALGEIWCSRGSVALLLVGLAISSRGVSEPGSGNLRLWSVCRSVGLTLSVGLIGLFAIDFGSREQVRWHGAPLGRPSGRPVLAGVHYYSWFPENWPAGYVGKELRPPVLPVLGEYRSDGEGVFAQHLAWMREGGINLIVFDWWAKRKGARKRIAENVAELRDGDPQFTIQYEPHDLKEPSEAPFPGEDDNVVVMTPERAERMVVHWRHLAKRFFRHPRYLRIDGRPVLFLYASRHLVGDVAGAIARAAAAVEAEIGVKPYVVGDEVYFNVLDFAKDRGVYLRAAGSPNWARVAAFDAITCYNGFDASRTEHGGSAGAERYFADMAKLYSRYRAVAAGLGIPFFPGVLPGYNDRGVRLNVNHMVFPRTVSGHEESGSAQSSPPSSEESSGESFFTKGLSGLIEPYLDRLTPAFVVTSWNEWNEGTQIEPSTVSPPSREDSSGHGVYTRGELHAGYGREYLTELQTFLHELQNRSR